MSTYEISKSSLLSLKAEILRKQDELVKAKVQNDIKIKTIKKNTPLEIKNKGVESRSKNDEVEDEDLLKLSRSTLEAKSKLYDKLSKNKTTTAAERDFNRRYLVRFDKKNNGTNDLPPSDDEQDIDKYPESEDDNLEPCEYDDPSDPSEEWVEYTDCLGRTRTCLRKDLEHIKHKDSELKKTVELKEQEKQNDAPKEPEIEPNNEDTEKQPVTENSELLSSDMRRELLRQQWEQEEEEMKNRNDIHYQNVLFNEARSHGVGYYAFSKDEEERLKQQEELKKLRDETEKQQKKSQDLKAMREKQLAARMRAAKNRKRARMGLPPEEEDSDSAANDKAKEEEEKKKAMEEEKKKQQEEEQERKTIEAARKRHLRPWDIGKEGVVKEHYEYTQEEWVDKKREERPVEFAPPTQYSNKPHRDFRAKSTIKDTGLDKKSLHFTSKKSDEKSSINPYKQDTNDFAVDDSDDQVDYNDRLLNDYNRINDSNELTQFNNKSHDFREKTNKGSETRKKTKLQFTVKKAGEKQSLNPYKQNNIFDIDDSEDQLLNDYKRIRSSNESSEVGNTESRPNILDVDDSGDQVDFDDQLLSDYNRIRNINQSSEVSNKRLVTKNYMEIPQNKPMEPVPIEDECEGDFDDRLLSDYNRLMQNVNSNVVDSSRGAGVEIPPPPSFDYYGPSDSKRIKKSVEKSSGGIMDSIEAGLRFIRQEAEKKTRRHEEDRW